MPNRVASFKGYQSIVVYDAAEKCFTSKRVPLPDFPRVEAEAEVTLFAPKLRRLDALKEKQTAAQPTTLRTK
jgi:hypothetical protein